MQTSLTSARRSAATAAFAAAFFIASAASAQPAPQANKNSGGELGLRLGYGLPFGELSDGNDLDGGVSGQIPVIIDLGYRFNPRVFAGLFLGYGFAQVNDNNNGCDVNTVSCSASVIRLGVNALYRFMPEQRFAPYLGAGLGYEWFRFRVSTSALGGINSDATLRGLELLNLQGGADYRLSGNTTIGPFASFSVGRYDKSSGQLAAGSGTVSGNGDVEDPSLHQWLILGVRGAFEL
jgi:opacity protein-like surface antigen